MLRQLGVQAGTPPSRPHKPLTPAAPPSGADTVTWRACGRGGWRLVRDTSLPALAPEAQAAAGHPLFRVAVGARRVWPLPRAAWRFLEASEMRVPLARPSQPWAHARGKGFFPPLKTPGVGAVPVRGSAAQATGPA